MQAKVRQMILDEE
jgi:hypothetical protein